MKVAHRCFIPCHGGIEYTCNSSELIMKVAHQSFTSCFLSFLTQRSAEDRWRPAGLGASDQAAVWGTCAGQRGPTGQGLHEHRHGLCFSLSPPSVKASLQCLCACVLGCVDAACELVGGTPRCMLTWEIYIIGKYFRWQTLHSFRTELLRARPCGFALYQWKTCR